MIQRVEIHNGQVAQSVEQRTENPCVGGSIPPLPIDRLLVGNPLQLSSSVYPQFDCERFATDFDLKTGQSLGEDNPAGHAPGPDETREWWKNLRGLQV